MHIAVCLLLLQAIIFTYLTDPASSWLLQKKKSIETKFTRKIHSEIIQMIQNNWCLWCCWWQQQSQDRQQSEMKARAVEWIQDFSPLTPDRMSVQFCTWGERQKTKAIYQFSWLRMLSFMFMVSMLATRMCLHWKLFAAQTLHWWIY